MNSTDDFETNTEEQDEKDIEEIDYSFSTNDYRKKLISKISIVFISSIIIFITRFFKYAPFDIVLSSTIFTFLLSVSVFFGIIILIYIYLTKGTVNTESKNKAHRSLHNAFDLISVIPIFMVIISLTNSFAVSPATVIGQSMEPTFYEGEDLVMLHITNNYQRFDVIVLKTNGGEFYLKRIIGLPGETVKIDHNVISINGNIIEQSFIDEDSVYTYCNSSHLQVCEFNVPEGSYFVMGDNREHSLDSRFDELGFVTEEQLYGRIVFKFNNIFRGSLN